MTRRPQPREFIRRSLPEPQPNLLDEYPDLTDALTAQQRQILAQALADSYYEATEPQPPSRAQVTDIINNLQRSQLRPRAHNHARSR